MLRKGFAGSRGRGTGRTQHCTTLGGFTPSLKKLGVRTSAVKGGRRTSDPRSGKTKNQKQRARPTPICWNAYASLGLSRSNVARSTPTVSVCRLEIIRAASCMCSAAARGGGEGGKGKAASEIVGGWRTMFSRALFFNCSTYPCPLRRPQPAPRPLRTRHRHPHAKVRRTCRSNRGSIRASRKRCGDRRRVFFSFNDVSSSLRRHTWNPKRKVSVYLFAVAIPTRFHNDARVFQPVLPP